ncbi:MAG: D-alanine--D-alanine ligase [Oscillospiraceae bacterium]|nr:D-alanine--D-alanine ligase [Oscillospiraceae bacterium]
MNKLNVLCLFGGNSTEYEISCWSFDSVIKNLDQEKFNIITAGISKTGEWHIYEGLPEKIRDLSWIEDLNNLYPCAMVPKSKENNKARLLKFIKKDYETLDIDVILPIIHGANGEDGTIQGLAQIYGVACAGADLSGSVYSYDKTVTKILCSKIKGLNQAGYLSFEKYEFDSDCENILKFAEKNIKFPMFIKPARAGSSVGIIKVKKAEELKQAVLEAFKFDDKVLIEENMTGKEIEVAVMGNKNNLTVSCPGEIKPNAEFYDYDTKYITNTAEHFIPADISGKTSEKVRETARQVYMQVGAGGFARVDFFVDGDEIYFNEINTIPGFTEISMFAKLLMHSENITYTELITRIIELAVEKT